MGSSFVVFCFTNIVCALSLEHNWSNNDPKNVGEKGISSPYLEGSVSIYTCCPLDLRQNPVRCKESTLSKAVPSTSVVLSNHVMAENITFTFSLFEQRKKECPEAEANAVFVDLNGSPSRENLFLKNGYLKVKDHYYHKDEYCINGQKESVLEVSVCPQNCKGPRPCIIKCCGLHQVYSFGYPRSQAERRGCQNPETTYFSPLLYQDFEHASTNSTIPPPHFIQKYPRTFKYQCPSNKTIMTVSHRTSEIFMRSSGIPIMAMPFRIGEDGRILYRDSDGTCNAVDPTDSDMCVDGVMNFGEDLMPFENRPDQVILFQCMSPLLPNAEGTTGSIVYGSLMIISSIFLLMTIVVFCILWKQQTVQGWTIFSHTTSMFFLYVFLGISHILRVTPGYSVIDTPLCRAIGVLSHFFYLSTFCWLSMLSVDLCLTLRGTNSKGTKRYILYSILGWGIPIAIVSIGLSVGAKDGSEGCATMISPGYGVENCYLQEKAQAVYLYYPVTVMMIVNVICFIITSINLCVHQKAIRMTSTKEEAQQELFYWVFFKLIIVMGITYIFEVVSSLYSGTGFFWYWAIFDVLNILRAIAIFIIFVCKPDVLGALEKEQSCLKPILIPCACIARRKPGFPDHHTEYESIGLRGNK